MDINEFEHSTEQVVQDNLNYKENYNSIMHKLYKVDENNKIVYVDLYFDKLSDIFQESNSKYRLFKQEFTDKFYDIFSMIDRKYKIKYIFHIKDLENNTKEDVSELFKFNFDYIICASLTKTKRKRIIALTLLIIGFLLLLTNVILFNINLFPNINSTFAGIFSEILDIAAWVFVWEAVTIYFFEISASKFKHRAIYKKLIGFEIISN